MKKKELEKAIELFERIPGATLVDNYISKLYKEEIDELSNFVKFISKDMREIYKGAKGKEFVDTIKKTYLVQLNETHQCFVTFTLETESEEDMIDGFMTDINVKFREFNKSSWLDSFIIKGAGKYEGITLKEYEDWDLLFRFLLDKKKDIAKYHPSKEQVIVETIDKAKECLDNKKD